MYSNSAMHTNEISNPEISATTADSGGVIVNQTNKKKGTGRKELPPGEKKKLIQIMVKAKNYELAKQACDRVAKRYNK